MDIMTEDKLSSIKVAIMDITYWSVRSSSRRGGDGVKGVDGGGTLFYSAKSFTLLLWCKIQVIINPFIELFSEER